MAGMVCRSLGLAVRLMLVACVPTADGLLGRGASTQAEGVFETWPLREGGGILEAMSAQKISLSMHSAGCSRGSSRPIRFEPPMLDFHEQPVGMPKMETVFLHNPSAEETITLLSISATTSHFHASFFQNRVIPPGGNTSFEVVFLARVVGNVENTLFINTSRHGVFTYQVFGVGIPNPYRLRPFVGARVPVNSSFSPLINIHNPHSEPLQVVEIYSSGGDLHLELPTGQAEGPKKLWEIPPFETKAVMRASFVSREADNHTAFIRIRTNGSEPHQYLILPVEVEVTTVPGIYSSIEMLDFGTLRTQDTPKTLNLYLLNSGSKDVPITSVKLSPPNDAVFVEFKPITLKAQERKYAKVASITYDPSKVKRPLQSSGKIVVKAKEKSYPKLEIVYQAEVLEGYLGYDQAATLFHVREGETEPSERPVWLTNTFNFSIILHNVSLPADVLHVLQVKNFSRAVLLRPQESCYAFSLALTPALPGGAQGTATPTGLATNVMLATNASHFQLPVQAYTGFLSHVVLPPSLQESQLEFGVLGAADMVQATVLILNSNPIELELKGWQVIGEGLTAELLGVERGNRTTAQAAPDLQSRHPEPHQRLVTLPPGHYAALRVTLSGAGREGTMEGALQVSTAYEILTIPVTAVIAVGSLSSLPSHVHLQASFPGKVVQQPVWVASSFSRAVRLEAVRPLGTDSRFYFRRAEDSPQELEPGQKTKIGNIYFNASAACDTDCYVGAGARWQDNLKKEPADTDSKLFRELQRRWASMRERGLHRLEAGFEVDTDLYKQVPVRVVAQLTWPSIVNTSGRPLTFPLTNRNTSSVEELILENLADVPVVCQVFPVRWYPSPGTAVRLLSERLNLEKYNVNETSGVFSVISDIKQPGASCGSPLVRVELGPGERRSIGIRFTPTGNHTETTLILIRNNLTVLDGVVVSGRGVNEALRLAGRPPGPNASLRFKVTEAVLRDCTDKFRPKLPTFTLTRTFRVENVGPLPLHVAAPEVSGLRCEGFGFRVVDCSVFVLEPNATRDIVIAFTPDFTASRVIRELRLRTARGSEFAFVLNASLPYHMLATCAEALPRPSWEALLYAVVLGLVIVTLPCVLVVAFMDAQEQWRQFREQQQAEAEQSLCEGLTDRPFDLRKIGSSLMQEHSSAQTQESTTLSRGRGLASTSSVATQRNSTSRQHQHHHSQHHHQQHSTDSHQTRGGTLSGQQMSSSSARGSPGSAGAARGSPGSGSSATAPPPHRSGNGGGTEYGTAGTAAAQGPSGKKQRNAKVQNSNNISSSSNHHSHHQQQTNQLLHTTQQTQNQPNPVLPTLTHQCGTQTPDKDERAPDIQAAQLAEFSDVAELRFDRKRLLEAGRPDEPEPEAEAPEEEEEDEEEEEERGERDVSEQSTAAAATTAMEALMGEMDGDEPSHVKRSTRGKKTTQRKVAKLQKWREDRERRVAGRGDDDDSSSTTTEASNPDLEPPHLHKASEQPLKQRSQASPPARKLSNEGVGGYGSRPGGAGGVSGAAVTAAVTAAAVASGGSSRKNGGGSRRDPYPDLREASSLELPYTTQFEQRQRRKDSSGFSNKPSGASSLKADVNPRNSKHGGFAKQRGKGSAGPMGTRASFGLSMAGTAGSGSGSSGNGGGKTSPTFASDPESSGTASRTNSSSEGEKDHSPPPEWDLPSLAGKTSSSTDSLHQLSLQTLNAEPLLNRHSRGSPVSGPSSPAPTQQGASYSSVVASNGDVGTKQTGGAVKGKLMKATSLPGRNGNPTFAAVAAGHEKMIAPLADPRKAVLEKSNSTGSLMLEEPCGFVEPTVPRDEVLASSVSAYRASVFTQPPPYTPPLTFSAFGPSNSFDLTGVFGRSRSGSGPQSSVGNIGSGLAVWAANYNCGPSGGGGGGGGHSPPASVAPPAVMTTPPCSASSSRCSSASPWSVLLSDSRPSSQGLWSTGPSSPTSPTSSPLLMGASNNMWAAHPFGSIWSTPGDTGLTLSVSTTPGHHPSSPSSHPSAVAPPPGCALPSSLSLQATSSNSSSSSSSSSSTSPFAGHTGSQSGIVGRGAGERMVAAPHPAHGDTPLAPFNPFGCSGLDHIWRPGPPPAAQRRSPWEPPDA